MNGSSFDLAMHLIRANAIMRNTGLTMRMIDWCAGAACVLLAGCVTINIYFPAAAAEKAADRIIDEVWQLKPGETAPKPAPAK